METIDAQQELVFIKKIMTDSRKSAICNGKAFILWGILVTIGLLVTYFSIINHNLSVMNWLWPSLIGLGWIITIVMESKAAIKSRTKTFAAKILAYVWIGSGIAMTIIGFVGSVSGAFSGLYINPLISNILAVGFLITGILYGKTWVSLISLGWWVGAIVMFLWTGLYTFLLMSAMMILFLVIPGVFMFKQYKKELIAE
ncbi:MAG TPA: hypothetical protein ENI57_03310 [Ignavibacteria bacterium]|nr:hypothetical protein [Ignavibacteria bacterium]